MTNDPTTRDTTRLDPSGEPASASRRSAIAPFIAMDVKSAANALEAAGQRVLHMEIGEPGAATPESIREAARRALGDGTRLGYTEALGWRPLRERIAAHYREAYGVSVPPERIAVTTGSSAAFNLAFLAAFDHGDRVAIASPGYPAYRNILTALGLHVVELPTSARDRHAITPEMLERAHAAGPLAGILIASPANPTGTLMTPEALRDLVTTADRLGIRFLSDEIYHRLVYAGQEETALAFSERAIVINSFSKYYCMTGWRIGWMVLPEDLVRPVERIGQNLYISAPDLSQRAALAAFAATAELDVIKAGYAANRKLLLERLPAIGFDDFFPVDGAFYVYAATRRFTNDSTAFAKAMLHEAGVAATPGPDFDRSRGDGYIRFSFAGSEAEVAEAVQRLEGWLKG